MAKHLLAISLSLLLVCTVGAGAQPPAALDGVPTFTADPDWPRLPQDFTWGQVIGIFADARGHVWTSSRSRISQWDAQGRLVQSWDARGPDGNWSTIHGLFVDQQGFVWTNARESQLTIKFTRAGDVAMVIGTFNQTGGSNDTTLMGRPSEVWVDPVDNEAFVADGYGNRRVIVFDAATGKYLRHWGAYGKPPIDSAPGAPRSADDTDTPNPQFAVPHGISGSRDGLIYLADRANNRLQVFRQDGQFVTEKILRARCGPQESATWAPRRPCGTEAAFSIAFSHDAAQSYLYVADGGSHYITILRRRDLEIVDEFGGPGVSPGQFGRPHNITVDPEGNIFVAEAAGPKVKHPVTGAEVDSGHRVQKLSFSGTKPAPKP